MDHEVNHDEPDEADDRTLYQRTAIFGYDGSDGAFHPVVTLVETTSVPPEARGDVSPPPEIIAAVEALTGYRIICGDEGGAPPKMPPPAQPFRDKRGGVIMEGAEPWQEIPEELRAEMHIPTDRLYPGQVLYRCRRACAFCGIQSTLILSADSLELWQSGVYVHEAFPALPKEIREMLISGTHPKCWDENMREEDDTDGPE